MRNGQRSWWLLYLLVPVMGGLLIIQQALALGEIGHQLAEAAIVVAIFSSIALWVRSNGENLNNSDRESLRRVLRIQVYKPQQQKPRSATGEPARELASVRGLGARRRAAQRSGAIDRHERSIK